MKHLRSFAVSLSFTFWLIIGVLVVVPALTIIEWWRRPR